MVNTPDTYRPSAGLCGRVVRGVFTIQEGGVVNTPDVPVVRGVFTIQEGGVVNTPDTYRPSAGQGKQ